VTQHFIINADKSLNRVPGYRFSTRPIVVYSIVPEYHTRCYFNVRSNADISQLNLPHGTEK